MRPLTQGTFHAIRPGETLWGIARRHKMKVMHLAQVNNIEDPGHLIAGQRLYIPVANTKAVGTADRKAG